MGKTRLEAFSDGVLAVAITLLVLDLRVDAGGGESLGAQLRHEWASFAAYAVSFFVIGVIWINHHALFALVARADRVLMFYNLLLLMFVTTIPFTTSTLAGYLTHGSDADLRWAVVLYGAAMEGMAVSFTLLLHRIAYAGLTRVVVEPPVARKAVLRFGAGTVIYPVVTAIGLLSAPLVLILYGALTGYYILEQTPILPASVPEGPSDA